jgi:hypothetical protein
MHNIDSRCFKSNNIRTKLWSVAFKIRVLSCVWIYHVIVCKACVWIRGRMKIILHFRAVISIGNGFNLYCCSNAWISFLACCNICSVLVRRCSICYIDKPTNFFSWLFFHTIYPDIESYEYNDHNFIELVVRLNTIYEKINITSPLLFKKYTSCSSF